VTVPRNAQFSFLILADVRAISHLSWSKRKAIPAVEGRPCSSSISGGAARRGVSAGRSSRSTCFYHWLLADCQSMIQGSLQRRSVAATALRAPAVRPLTD